LSEHERSTFDVETTWEVLLSLTKAGQALEEAHERLRLVHGGTGEHTATIRILYESCLALVHETWQAFLAFRTSESPEVRTFVEGVLEAARTVAQDQAVPARERETVPPSTDDDASPHTDAEDHP